MDELDEKLVAILRNDGRISVPALAEQAGTSRATAYARFNRLVDSGVITGFGATIDHAAIGLPIAALIMVRTEQREWPEVSAELRATYGVEWVALAAGSFDFVALVRAASLSELRDVVLDGMLSVPGVRNVETSVILDELGSIR